MNKPARYTQEVRERSVRRIFEHTEEYGSQRAAIRSIAGNLGMSPETLRPADLVDRDSGPRARTRSGLPTSPT